jgi:uncharacterized membrane protein (UPF0182 family)
MRQYRLALALAALVLIVLILVPLFSVVIGLLVDRIWFSHIGFREIFVTILETQMGLGVCCGAGFLLFSGVNSWAAQRVALRSGYRRAITRMIEIPAIEKFPSFFARLMWFGLVLMAWLVGQWAAAHWGTYLLATHAVPITRTDPIFGISLSFYLFHLPFLFFIYHFALIILAMSLLTAVLQYFIAGGIWISPRGLGMGRNARGHLMVLGGLLFLLFAWRARLGMYDLVYAPTGLVYGAGYTDVHVGWPVLWIQLVLCAIAAIAFFAGAPKGQIRPAGYAVGSVLGVAILGGLVVPALVQRYLVAPSELEKEVPYIARNIEFTRQAYGLDRFDERDFPAIQDLTAASIQQNAATMQNLRLWDHEPQLTTFQQLQEIRTYYDFANIYYDRYTIDSKLRQVSLSARELSADSLPDPNWVNQHLTYTHGYGLCLGPVNESTPDGLPVLFIKDIPPVSSISLKVTRPEIYYGEVSNNYCLVGTGAKEFDHPSGEDNVYKTYQGSGGIPVAGLWRRLIFALRFGDINILISGYIQPTSRIMLYRRILERVETLAPFLSYDSHPYLVVANDGSLQWIVDAYTTSDQYPYSEPTQDGGNYIRNSVKVTISAYVRSVDPGLSADFSGRFSAALGDAAGPSGAHPLPAGSLCDSGSQICRVSHDGPKRLLQQGRLVARGHTVGKRNIHADESLLRRYEIARSGKERRIYPDGSVHACAEEQHDCLDSGPLRRSRLRKGSSVHLSQRETDLRTGTDSIACEPKPYDLSAAHPLESGWIPRDSRHAASGPGAECGPLC